MPNVINNVTYISQSCGTFGHALRMFKWPQLAFGHFIIKRNIAFIQITSVFLTNESLHDYITMLFGLCNVPMTFSKLMGLMFADYIKEFITIYLDNILVYSEAYL